MTEIQAAELFNKFALGAVAIISMVVGPIVQWRIAVRQTKMQEEISLRQTRLQEEIARRQLADSVASKRNVWRDGLRVDLAEFLSLYGRVFNHYWNKRRPSGLSSEKELDAGERRDTWNEAQPWTWRATELSMRVRLRLSANVEDHQALASALDEARDLLAGAIYGPDLMKTMQAWNSVRKKLLERGAIVLMQEWEEAKP